MSQQLPDPFVVDSKTYIFVSAEDIYTLFDPKKYGLNPTSPHTACWKGFVIHFCVKDKMLYISKLEVNCDDNNYPDINGVAAKQGEKDGELSYFHVYENLDMFAQYTGKIVLGTRLDALHAGSAFTGPHSYEQTYDLMFNDGKLIYFEESTGKYSGFGL